jgi:hypothetical protein
MKLFAVIFSILISTSCQRSATTSAFDMNAQSAAEIVNGRTLKSKDPLSKHVVLISLVDLQGGNKVCTGVFISPTKILTAQHCISESISDMSVTFKMPSYDSDLDVVDLPILRTEIVFNKNILARQDLAMIEVRIPANDFPAEPVEISKGDSIIDTLVLVGFGTNSSANFVDEQLRTKSVKLRSNQFQKNYFAVDQNKNKGGICFGDSGGPALHLDQRTQKYVLVGIASAVVSSPVTDICGNQSLFMNVLFYKNEIEGLL